MVLLLITLLAVSVVGMLSLLWVKHYELSTGNLLFAGSRPALSKFSSRAVFLFGTALPHFVRYEAHRSYSWVAGLMHRLTAHGVLRVETWLERTLNSVREK